MSELRKRMAEDLKLAGLAPRTCNRYLQAVQQLAAYYMVAPDQLNERQVQQYLLYVRDELGVAKGTFEPLLAGIKFFYLKTLGQPWSLFSKKLESPSKNGSPTFVPITIAANSSRLCKSPSTGLASP